MSLSKEISLLFKDDIWELPPEWSWVHMSDIAVVVGGGTPKSTVSNFFGDDVPWITPADMSKHEGIYISKGYRSLSDLGYENCGAQKMPANTVLLSSRAPIGYVAIASNELTTNQGFKSYVPEKGVSSKFLYYWLSNAKPLAEKLASGTTFLEISGKNSGLLPLPLAPENEQTRIVEKLEELLSDLDNGVAELKAAQRKLTQYRQSLLKSAVEGSLTEQWRITQRENEVHGRTNVAGAGSTSATTETGEQLLQRILKERRQRWEAQKQAEFEARGKKPPKDWQLKYPEPVQPDTSELPELPEGWTWASLDMIISSIESGKSFKCYERPPQGNDYGVVKISAVTWGEYNEEESKTCMTPDKENPNLLIKKGDFLFSRANTTELVGACVIAKKVSKNIMLSDKIWRINLASP